mmetsp:Transcript_12470/g.50133  ORF Transcript_12470/g.50133 Transcript_12470/m.50133 type:complete len:221 (-) Transcript_12470:173-835(-)
MGHAHRRLRRLRLPALGGYSRRRHDVQAAVGAPRTARRTDEDSRRQPRLAHAPRVRRPAPPRPIAPGLGAPLRHSLTRRGHDLPRRHRAPRSPVVAPERNGDARRDDCLRDAHLRRLGRLADARPLPDAPRLDGLAGPPRGLGLVPRAAQGGAPVAHAQDRDDVAARRDQSRRRGSSRASRGRGWRRGPRRQEPPRQIHRPRRRLQPRPHALVLRLSEYP